MSQSIVLSFDKSHATKYGLHEAIVLYHIRYWIENNHIDGRNERDGRTWSYQSFEAIHAHLSILSRSSIHRAIENLIKKHKVLIKGNYNKNKFDRTQWYAFNDQDAWIRDDYKKAKRPNRDSQNEQIDDVKMGNGCSKSGNGSCQIGTTIPKDYTEDKHKTLSPNGDRESARESYGKHVKLSKSEKEAFDKKHGEAKVNDMIERINDYVESTGKKYKENGYAATLRNWFRNDSSKKPTQGSHNQIDRSHKDANGQKINSDYERLF